MKDIGANWLFCVLNASLFDFVQEIHSFSGHSGAITACCYAEDKLCSASTDSTISVWDLNTGQR